MARAIMVGVIGLVVGLFAVAPVAHASAASGSVSVTGVVRSEIRLHITTPDEGQSVSFGGVEPGSVTPPQTVGIEVSSNRPYSVSTLASDADVLGLSTSLAGSSGNVATNATMFVDTYTLDVPETTDPGAYVATVQYTVVQE